jgi:single stranded DNA-binding protein
MNQLIDQTTIVGFVGKDATCKAMNNTSSHLIQFPVAISQSWKDASGQEHEQTKWYSCTLWVSEKNTNLKNYFLKGNLVMVQGESVCNAWLNKDGELQSQLELRVSEWKVLKKTQTQKPAQSLSWELGDGC